VKARHRASWASDDALRTLLDALGRSYGGAQRDQGSLSLQA
jgi:hypothetical protein